MNLLDRVVSFVFFVLCGYLFFLCISVWRLAD